MTTAHDQRPHVWLGGGGLALTTVGSGASAYAGAPWEAVVALSAGTSAGTFLLVLVAMCLEHASKRDARAHILQLRRLELHERGLEHDERLRSYPYGAETARTVPHGRQPEIPAPSAPPRIETPPIPALDITTRSVLDRLLRRP